jgi:hypothetical protein
MAVPPHRRAPPVRTPPMELRARPDRDWSIR